MPGSPLSRPLAAAVLCAVLLPAAQAAAIAIDNPGFESPQLAPGAGTFATSGSAAVAGWLISGFAGGGAGVSHPLPAAPPFAAGVPEGNQFGYAEAATLSQRLGTTLTEGLYTLSMQVGNPSDRSDIADPARFELYLPDTGRVIASSAAITLQSLPNGSFAAFTASAFIGAADPDFGQALGVRMLTGLPISTTGPYFAFDDVQLSLTPVPEPQTWALLGSGVALLAWRRRAAASACA